MWPWNNQSSGWKVNCHTWLFKFLRIVFYCWEFSNPPSREHGWMDYRLRSEELDASLVVPRFLKQYFLCTLQCKTWQSLPQYEAIPQALHRCSCRRSTEVATPKQFRQNDSSRQRLKLSKTLREKRVGILSGDILLFQAAESISIWRFISANEHGNKWTTFPDNSCLNVDISSNILGDIVPWNCPIETSTIHPACWQLITVCWQTPDDVTSTGS
jgi:hypothetical protein